MGCRNADPTLEATPEIPDLWRPLRVSARFGQVSFSQRHKDTEIRSQGLISRSHISVPLCLREIAATRRTPPTQTGLQPVGGRVIPFESFRWAHGGSGLGRRLTRVAWSGFSRANRSSSPGCKTPSRRCLGISTDSPVTLRDGSRWEGCPSHSHHTYRRR